MALDTTALKAHMMGNLGAAATPEQEAGIDAYLSQLVAFLVTANPIDVEPIGSGTPFIDPDSGTTVVAYIR